MTDIQEPSEGDEKIQQRVASNDASASLVGLRLGEYQILRKLGRGGMADVYAARHLSLGREVAIKVLRSDYARDKDYISRFRREARAAAKLNHANIVQVYDVGDVEGNHFIAQELVDGSNLREIIQNQGPIDTDEAIEILISVAAALDAASAKGIIHRDIKPENIMRSMDGIIKVADFGLARLVDNAGADETKAQLTQIGLTMGTPRYMSPEQAQGKVADVRSDLYSLGVSMYHLLAGRPPFEADEPLALAVMHLHETPTPLDRARRKNDLPEWLIAVVSRLINKVPADRFQSPSELIAAVQSRADISSKDAFTVGTAAATIRLQRVTDALFHRKKRFFARWAGVLAFAFLGVGLGCAAAFSTPATSLREILVPDQVQRQPNVRRQFFEAIMRDDALGWMAVSEEYPPGDNATNLTYDIKSKLQLARLYEEEQKYQEAIRVLDDVLGKSEIDPKFLVVAWARKCSVLEKLKDVPMLNDAKRKFRAYHDELNEEDKKSLERVVPPSILMLTESVPKET